MLEKHNQMLVELLSKLHPSGSLAADDWKSLAQARESMLFLCASFVVLIAHVHALFSRM
jgi:hypothetical protein